MTLTGLHCRAAGSSVAVLAALFTTLAAWADVNVHRLDSQALAENTVGMSSLRTIMVYVPPGYEGAAERYPTVYYLPGYRFGTVGFPGGSQLDLAIEDGRLPPTIFVVINADTNVGGTAFLNSIPFGMWEEFLIDELVAFIDTEYRTIADPRRRALLGWSMGGYSAVVLPLRNPGIWGAVGTNDASMQAGCDMLFVREPTFEEELAAARSNVYQMIQLQIGSAILPNSDSPWGFDMARDAVTGRPIPELRDIYDRYCFTNESAIDYWRDEIMQLHLLAITVGADNAYYNRTMSEHLATAGAKVEEVPIEGGHSDFVVERTLMLSSRTLNALLAIPVVAAVNPHDKTTATWGTIKHRARARSM